MVKIPLGPGPRPKITDEERARVADAVQGLGGFQDRPTAGPVVQPPATAPAPEPPKSKAKPKPAPVTDAKGWSIKFDVSDEVYQALLLETVRKRVTMKYLMLEILHERGLPVDLENASKDGRRER